MRWAIYSWYTSTVINLRWCFDWSVEQQEGAMKVQAALMRQQGLSFVVVAARLDLIYDPSEADMAIDRLQPSFGGLPVILVAQDVKDEPHYYGDPGIIKSLSGIALETMPWLNYVVTR